MTTEPPVEHPPVEVIPDDPSLVKTSASGVIPEKLTTELQELVEAIRTKAFEEAQKVGEFAQENYLDAVRQAKEQVENLDLFDRDRIESAIQQLQTDVEKDWEKVVGQVNEFGDRLSEAAKTAWEILTKPKD
ncbi:MAG: hypothetical protein ACKO5Q_21340 [Microcystaceae cyanobacterium]